MQRLNLTAKSIVPRIANAAQKSQQSRKMGGHGHGHASAKHGQSVPYEAKHGKEYSDVAYPFGIVPGTPLQGWEIPTYSFLFLSFLITFVGIGYCKKDTTFTVRKCDQMSISLLTEYGNGDICKQWITSTVAENPSIIQSLLQF